MSKKLSSLLLSLIAFSAKVDSGGLPMICGYLPRTAIIDESLLDLDLLSIRDRLTAGQLVKAQNVYEEGGHSKAAAVLTLLDPPASYNFPQGTQVYGLTEIRQRQELVGELQSPLHWFEGQANETVVVQYSFSNSSHNRTVCFVGGLSSFEAATFDGCFHDGIGTVEFVLPGNEEGTGDLFPYSYDIHIGNINLRTFQGLSLNAASTMKSCPDCAYFDSFQKFFDYYGDPAYADKWIKAASFGNQTAFSNSKGDSNFASYSRLGRAEGMLHGIVAFNLFMEVIRELEESIQQCRTICTNRVCAGQEHIHALDKSVAFFCGSLSGEQGENDGLFLYDLAKKRHGEFHPSVPASSKHMGDMIIDTYQNGQLALMEGDCSFAASQKEDIIDLMKVTLVQSVLRYAYLIEKGDFRNDLEREKASSIGVTYTAALLPFLHACDEQDAETVYNNLSTESETTSLLAIKSALERQYNCLRVACDDVGGILTDDGYAKEASPCHESSLHSTQSTENDHAKPGPLIFGVTVFILCLLLFSDTFKKKRTHRRQRAPLSPGTNIAAVSDLA
ncbi:hypothetical protein ACA910_012767 [Epithemia clementina (nom. ined.)]